MTQVMQAFFMRLGKILPILLSLAFVFALHLLVCGPISSPTEAKRHKLSFSLMQKPEELQKKEPLSDKPTLDIAPEKSANLQKPHLEVDLRKMQMPSPQISLAGRGKYEVFGGVNAEDASDALLHSIQDGGEKRYSMQIFGLASLDKIPKRLNSVKIDYPKNLLKRGIQGTVVLLVVIDERGFLSVEKVEKSGHEEFTESAINAAQKLRYEPPTIDGKLVKARFTLPIPFRILK